MKRIRINTGKAGLVFKNGEYQRVLTAGVYFLGWREKLITADMGLIFNAPISLDILLRDEKLKAMLHVVEVADNQLALAYKNNRFLQVFTAGRYVYWKGHIDFKFTMVDLDKIYITEDIDKSLFNTHKLGMFIRKFEVENYEKAVLLVDDQYVKTLSGGTYRFWKNDTSIKIAKVDMRQQQLEIAGQELLTQDKATVRVNFYAQFKVTDIEKALLENKNYEKQLYVVLQLALRAFIGGYTLDKLLESKDELAEMVLKKAKEAAAALGVQILSTGIRDIILTGEMKQIMNQVLMAQKQAQANVITRREETASTRSLLNTAKLMEDNEMLFALKEMEYVEKIADKIGQITVAGNGGVVKQLKEIFELNK